MGKETILYISHLSSCTACGGWMGIFSRRDDSWPLWHLGSGFPVKVASRLYLDGSEARAGFLGKHVVHFPPICWECTVPIHIEIQCLCVQLYQTTSCRILSKLLKFKPNICSETSSAVRPRQTSVIMAMRVRWGKLLCWGIQNLQMQLAELKETHELNAVHTNNASDKVTVHLDSLVHKLWPESSVLLLVKNKISGLYLVH